MRFIKSNGKQLRNELQKFPRYYYNTFSLSRTLVAGLVFNNTIVAVCGILGMSNYVVIYIDEAYRGQGLGKQILKKTISTAKNQGLVFLTTSMALNNIPSMRLFQKLGFREIMLLKKVNYAIMMLPLTFTSELLYAFLRTLCSTLPETFLGYTIKFLMGIFDRIREL